MNNINWKARLQSGPFWMGLASAVVAAVFTLLPLCGVELSVTAEQVMQAVTVILMIPAALGIISDPTTKGIADSAQALTYTEPAENNRQREKRIEKAANEAAKNE